jgi:hypothetical protein
VASRGPDDPLWEARIRDISVSGLGLVAVRRFECGTALAVEIPEEGDYAGDTLLARVVRVEPLPEGAWLLGCTFVSTLSEDTVCRVARLGQGTAASEGDGSPETDFAGSVAIPRVVWRDAESGAERVSRHLLLTGHWPLRPQTVLKIWVESNTGIGDYTRISVHSCQRHGDHWVVYYSVLGRPSSRLTRWIQRR